MEEVTYNNKIYIHTDYILGNAPIYSRSCRSGKELIRKKKIDDYLYFRFDGCEWINTDGKSRKYDKVFVNKTVIENIKELNGDDVTDDDGIEMAPDIIELEDHEKFQDTDGNILNIETRGVREDDKIYFKVKDVEKAFGIKRLDIILTQIQKDKTNSYINNIDYKYFNCKIVSQITKNQIRKTLFLTYEGIIRVLYLSRTVKAKHFIKWVTKTLFTVQLGTVEQKKELFNKSLGCDIDTSRKIIKTNNNKLSAIYLLTLGYVRDFRDSMDIDDKYDDDMIVCKYGRTDDLYRRLNEHKKTFKNIKNATPMLKLHSYIDNNYSSDAERKVKMMFDNYDNDFSYGEFIELTVVSNKFMKYVTDQYYSISNQFIGTQHDIIKEIKEIEHQHQMQLLQKDMEINEIKHQLAQSIKDNKILELQLQIQSMNK
jgi:hypothetical protein